MWLDGYPDDIEFITLDWDGFTSTIYAKEPGVYWISSHKRSGNVRIYKALKLNIADENGIVPELDTLYLPAELEQIANETFMGVNAIP